jgi:hypothetical protein
VAPLLGAVEHILERANSKSLVAHYSSPQLDAASFHKNKEIWKKKLQSTKSTERSTRN